MSAAGATAPAADARIELALAGPAATCLRVMPPRGGQRVDAQFTLAEPPSTYEATLDVQASGAKGGTSAPVAITIQPDYEVEFL